MSFRNIRVSRRRLRRIGRKLNRSHLLFDLKEQKREQSIFLQLNENAHPRYIWLPIPCFELVAIPLVKNERDNLKKEINYFFL